MLGTAVLYVAKSSTTFFVSTFNISKNLSNRTIISYLIPGLLILADIDLCQNPHTNDCDPASTHCVTSGGKFTCECKTGFKEWRNVPTMCQGK